MASPRLQRALDSARSAASKARENARANKVDLVRKGTNAASSYFIGSMHANGTILRMPQIWGLPRVMTLAAGTQLASMLMPKGTFREAVSGIAESSTSIALFQLGAGQAMSGRRAAAALPPDARRLVREAERMAREAEAD